MSKIKSSSSSHYELLFIIPNRYTEGEANLIVDKVKKIIADNNGNIVFSEDWGKKHLAYKIGGYSHGYYSLLEFSLKGNELEKVNSTLKMSNEILRHQIIKKAVKTEQQIEEEKKIAEKIAKKAVKKEKDKDKRIDKNKDKDKDKGKMELKDLDKRLDRILDTDDLL